MQRTSSDSAAFARASTTAPAGEGRAGGIARASVVGVQLHMQPDVGVCSIRYDERIPVLLLRQQRGYATQPAPGLWNGRRPLVSSSGARRLHCRGCARVGAARSRSRGAAALLAEAKHQPRPSDPALAHVRADDPEPAAPQHIARRGRSVGATVRGCYAAPMQSRKQASAGPTRDAWFATNAITPPGPRRRSHSGTDPDAALSQGERTGVVDVLVANVGAVSRSLPKTRFGISEVIRRSLSPL